MKNRLIGVFLCLFLSAIAPAFAMEWEWLEAMRVSVQQENYRGEFMHRRGNETSVYSVVHQFENNQITELLRQLDGDMIEVLRQGMKIVCYFPEHAEDALNLPVPAAPYSQVYKLDLERISQNYKAVSMGEARVAGYNTRVIELDSDDWRYTQKLWLEVNSNLLLQSEIIDTNGEVLEQFRFTRLQLGVNVEAQELIPTLSNSSSIQQTGFKEMPTQADDSAFETKLEWMPTGFSLAHAEHRNEAEGWVEQRTYSDGLSSFSLFIEKQSKVTIKQTAVAKMGATTALMTSSSGLAVTLIGEIPGRTAKKVVEALLIPSQSL